MPHTPDRLKEAWSAARARLAEAGLMPADAYFASLIPLVDVALADGEVQREEHLEMQRQVRLLVDRLNATVGYAAFSYGSALTLVAKLRELPLSKVHQLTAQVRALELEGGGAELAFSRIVAGTLRVAAASKTLEGDRLVHFCREERLRIDGILQALAVTRHYVG